MVVIIQIVEHEKGTDVFIFLLFLTLKETKPRPPAHPIPNDDDDDGDDDNDDAYDDDDSGTTTSTSTNTDSSTTTAPPTTTTLTTRPMITSKFMSV